MAWSWVRLAVLLGGSPAVSCSMVTVVGSHHPKGATASLSAWTTTPRRGAFR